MEPFLIRLLITIGVIWLTQTLLSEFNIKENARKIIFYIVLFVMLCYLVFAFPVLPIHV